MGGLDRLIEKYMKLLKHYDSITITQVVKDLRNLQRGKIRIIKHKGK